MVSQARLWIQSRLEEGAGARFDVLGMSRLWERAAAGRLARPLAWRGGKAVICVGGATLGGSGKTPLAMACAAHLARHSEVALVGHAYRARPGRARVVTPRDSLDEVGDEALMCARAFAELGVVRAAVVVAPTRQAALDLAHDIADVAVIDGVHQTAPRRASLALLAQDAARPHGSGVCPPGGDLRAPLNALEAACDVTVTALSVCHGARVGGERELLSWSDLPIRKLGLWACLARPERVLSMLAENGIVPKVTAFGADHSGPSTRQIKHLAEEGQRARLDLWVASPKCSLHLPASLGGVRVAILNHAVLLPASIAERLDETWSRVSPASQAPSAARSDLSLDPALGGS